MRDYSEFSTADFVAILPPIVVGIGSASIATAALLVILMEIHRRGHISDRTVHIDGQPLNDEVVNALNEVNETVSTATDLVDRTTPPGNLNEILARLPEEGIALRNIDLDEFRTITTDFLDAFEQFMNIL
ncbi:hypothetical protein NEUTE2DRAFT_133483 [Neurospora tetrasperma FGSC 2509]|nr:hypothetical protein NEUTE2DRAFT_133483 [Neurospora tetrasperma FGSC 2509]